MNLRTESKVQNILSITWEHIVYKIYLLFTYYGKNKYILYFEDNIIENNRKNTLNF